MPLSNVGYLGALSGEPEKNSAEERRLRKPRSASPEAVIREK